jgi:hypothetical protein
MKHSLQPSPKAKAQLKLDVTTLSGLLTRSN